METISPPEPRTISTVASAASTVTSQPTTNPPSRANAGAVARPMLPPVPVMTHTFPSRLPGISVLLGPQCCSSPGSWVNLRPVAQVEADRLHDVERGAGREDV